MKEWEVFEVECQEYLSHNYGVKYNCVFNRIGGHNSNSPDIKVVRNDNPIFSMEVKMANAQCGQFVLFANEETKQFEFSERNKCPLDKNVKEILTFMNNNFDKYKKPSNENIDIEESKIINWVKGYYIEIKKSEFCITKDDNEFIILPINKMERYFNFSAKYRIKNSGSSNPTRLDHEEIKILLQKNMGIEMPSLKQEEKSLYAEIFSNYEKFILQGNKYRYQFQKENNRYKIRRLSNTRNANFIVSISLKSNQKEKDLDKFKKALIE